MNDFLTERKNVRNRRSLVEEAVEILRDEIISGELAPGNRIPLEETAERLGMSGVPLREALESLVAKGLVVAVRQRGYRVSEIDYADSEDLYSVRLMLEPHVARSAAEKITDDQVARLELLYRELLAATTKKTAREANKRFHLFIYSVYGSMWTIRVIEMLWDAGARYRELSISEHDGNVEHSRIMQAIRERNGLMAEQATKEHIEATIESMHRNIKKALNL